MTTNSPNPVDGDVQAQPVAWAHRLVNKLNGTIHPWVYGSKEKEPSEGDIFRVEVMPLYAAPPAQVLRPVELPKETGKMGNDFWLGEMNMRSAFIKAIREAGYEVKS
ncbi:hypothetical protein [Pantoea ananatis]|uniref:hypothetical protein n=1 Tax=Pantoea ananas TaxID=553 RepID=UPI00049607E1|nr:hypothetical protein [Pantoea ananatis]